MVDDVAIRNVVVQMVDDASIAQIEGVNDVTVGPVNGADGTTQVIPGLTTEIHNILQQEIRGARVSWYPIMG